MRCGRWINEGGVGYAVSKIGIELNRNEIVLFGLQDRYLVMYQDCAFLCST